MLEYLQNLKEELFDAPSNIKEAFNAVVNYFDIEYFAGKRKSKTIRDYPAKSSKRQRRSNVTKLRSLKGIKEYIDSNNLTDKNLYYELYNNALYEAAHYGGHPLLIEEYYTYTEKGRTSLYSKLLDLREKFFKKYPEYEEEFNRAFESIENERLEAERKREEARLEAERQRQEKYKKDVDNLDKKYPGLKLLLSYGKANNELMRLNPWSSIKRNFIDVPTTKLEKGKAYFISRGTYYMGNRGYGLHFPSVILYLGDNKCNVLLETGYYGPSSWCSIKVDPEIAEINIESAQPLNDFISKNKSELERLIKIYTDEIREFKERHGDYVPDWDPNWGMN